MNFSTLPALAKVAVGAAGACAVVGGTVALTAFVTGSNLDQPPAALVAPPTPPSPPAPSISPSATPNPALRAVATAVLEAEAQVLGIQPRELRSDFRAGTTLQTLAAQKNISEAQFQAQLAADLKPILDQDVQRGTITSAQEQAVLRRVAAVVPNWDRVGATRQQPAPSPTP